MSDKIFIDTNILIYCFSVTEPFKRDIARNIIEKEKLNIVLSTQVLGEFTNGMYRKFSIEREIVSKVVIKLIENFEISIITTKEIEEALFIFTNYKYSYYDSLIISTALSNNCKILYSEDLQHGQVINGKLEIINPFKE